MTVKILSTKALPQCQGVVSTEAVLAYRPIGASNRCRNVSKYEIDGTALCARHASIVALEKILEGAEHA